MIANAKRNDSPACPRCGSRDVVSGTEYAPGHSERYDGVSEWRCVCGARYGRWSGRELVGDDYERKYGREEKTP